MKIEMKDKNKKSINKNIPCVGESLPRPIGQSCLSSHSAQGKYKLNRLKLFKKKLLSRETISEKIVEKIFTSKGLRFKKQYIIAPYIADFFIFEKLLIIEIDGSIHNTSRIKEKDYRRDDYFLSLGVIPLHFKNKSNEKEILSEINKFPILSKDVLDDFLRRKARINMIASDVLFKFPSDIHSFKELNSLYDLSLRERKIIRRLNNYNKKQLKIQSFKE